MMSARRRGINGAAGLIFMGVAVAMAWSFLQPVGDLEASEPDRLGFVIDSSYLQDDHNAPEVFVDHNVEPEWEYLTIQVRGAADAVLTLSLDEGNVRGTADWFCGPGVQAAAGGHPSSYRRLQHHRPLELRAGRSIDIAETLRSQGTEFERATVTQDAFGVSCQRVGQTYERRSQGLILLSSASVSSSFPPSVQASLSQSLTLPTGWERAGERLQVSTTEHFGRSVGREGANSYSFVSSPERASQIQSSDQIDGVQLIRDTVAESDEATRAWLSALIAGAAAALLLSAVQHPAIPHVQVERGEVSGGSGAPARAEPGRRDLPALIALIVAIILYSCRRRLGR
jgi:hypothetical protein